MKNILKVNEKFDIGALIISLLISLGLGTVVGMFTSNSSKIYGELIKPKFSPPGFIFSIVWTVLYVLMGIAAYRIYLYGKDGVPVKRALLAYAIQLVLNFLWPFIFFNCRLYGLAFIELCILWIAIVITTIRFYKIDKTAAYLMIPYIIWVTFAGVLNFFIWKLNEM
ncbi:TspO/MBR family protein [Clostridium amazonitimonense]|uniref:TspO/MBR family protein n=1 Tax=Clostridium amazonitimonense TaxID=1499689 RepID=UPI0005094105|nr:TspO/MBR family protein [Clostridium amazonitimonense]